MKTTQETTLRNIVCIDDEVDYFILRKQLKLTGSLANTWHYNNPLLALKDLKEKIHRIEPDLFIVDNNMPEMNGLDCIENIQKIIKEVYPQKIIPIILYSSGNVSLKTILEKPGIAFIEKPVHASHIEALLNTKMLSEKVCEEITSDCL